ncbi:MarR family winged helix-turn-helix transcriptional regulator [Streptomyces sp. 1331.2]|uniref:MarR family winged helix-turn-helix transcriptional regulator n=1 Tax=Streptomyces sp. 1331.2 TaxID=1938835 RepID=UPI000BC69753|nr:MarR family transcriptional regulator [Streptomyces sp. 1331.2]SOB88508.1 DNA-binding transcriptional regulator, MarR family [Streptomyces sp. 1331.2]
MTRAGKPTDQPSDQPSREELMARLHTAGRELSTAAVMFHAALAQLNGLSATEEKAIDLLLRHGPLTARELGEHSGLAPASVTGLVDRLQRKGFARRVPNPLDGRSVLIEAAEAPSEALAPHFTQWTGALDALCERYSDTELAAIVDFLGSAAVLQREATARMTTSRPTTPGTGATFEAGTALGRGEKLTLQTAAHGVVALMAGADPGAFSSARAGMAGGKALSAATGLVGRVLAEKPKGMKLGGKSTADLADQVFPALAASLALLRDLDPGEADNFRSVIRTAVEAALKTRHGGSPAMTAMAAKISTTLDNA